MCIRDRFYLTETSFNIDLNQDGRVGGPPNQDPLLTGQKATLADGTQNNNYTIDYWDLIQGFTDPEGDYLSIEEGSLQVNNGSIYFDQYFQHYVFTPDTDFSGQVDISYNVIDENGGSVAATQSFNINAPKPKTYSVHESEGNISIVIDEDDFGYARDAQGNTTPITYMGEHTKLGMWGGNWNFQAAENIDGQNAVIWKEQYSDGYLSLIHI